MGFHENAPRGDIHGIHFWTYATEADRASHNPFEGPPRALNADDVSHKRICWVVATNLYYVLLSYSPIIWHRVGAYVTGYISGLRISNNSINPDEQVDVDAGSCRCDTNDCDFDYGGGTVDITASGADGLDAGVVSPSTFYAVWLIFNPTTNTLSLLLSASFTSPTMPSGYTKKRRLGAVKTNATSDIYRFVQLPGGAYRTTYWEGPRADFTALFNGNETTWTEVDFSPFMPPTCFSCQLIGHYESKRDGNQAQYRTKGSVEASPMMYQEGTGNDVVVNSFWIAVSDDVKIEYIMSDSQDSLDILVKAYNDRL